MTILAIDPGTTQSAEQERLARRKESLRRAQVKYRQANREKMNEKQRIARKANPEKNAERMRAYRAKRPDVIAAIEARRVRPDGHREKFNAYRRAWAKANPDKLREHAHKRGGKKIGRLEPGSIRKIGSLQKWKCAVCTTNLRTAGYHKDHKIPLALGGEHSAMNIQLLCPACNLAKGAKDPIEFMQSRGLLL